MIATMSVVVVMILAMVIVVMIMVMMVVAFDWRHFAIGFLDWFATVRVELFRTTLHGLNVAA